MTTEFPGPRVYSVEVGKIIWKLAKMNAFCPQSMQDALMFTLADLLKSSWTAETSEAWKKLFQFITEHMIFGLQS